MTTAKPASEIPFSRQWALFLDIDGTLLELAETPDRVTISAALPGLLARLNQRLDGALALISGRRLSDIDRLFGLPRLPAAGLHGMEYRDGTGDVAHLQSVNESVLAEFKQRLQEYTREHPELLLEDKALSLAVHFRRAPHLQQAVEDIVKKVIENHHSEFHLQSGKMIAEIKPAASNKGLAIRHFMQAPPFAGGRVPVFIGDDVTDEDGFAAVNEMRGLSVKVGDGRSMARYHLPDPPAVVDWLNRYLDFLSATT